MDIFSPFCPNPIQSANPVPGSQVSVQLGLFRDNGKENGSYPIIGLLGYTLNPKPDIILYHS